MKKIPALVHWLNAGQQEDRSARLRCKCGVHVYKWNWRILGFECIYCKKRRNK